MNEDTNNNQAGFWISFELSNVSIMDVKRNEDGDYNIKVRSTLVGTKCGKCGQDIRKFHSNEREISLRDLPIFGCQVFIKMCPIRYKCKRCNSTTTQQLEWYYQRSPNTKRFEEHILLQLINCTIQDVAKKEKVTYDIVEGIIDRHIKKEVDWNEFETLEVLGIDEIANLKGHRQYFAIITARIGQDIKILTVLPDRKKRSVKKFLNKIPHRLKITVHTVCTDMNEGYINAFKEVFKQPDYKINIVIDRFHVAKNYRECVEDLRKIELKRIKQEISEEEFKKLKNVHWALRKKASDLTDAQKEQLEFLFTLSEALCEAYKFMNDLTNIFELRISRNSAKKKINQWKEDVKASSLTCFDKFLRTLTKHLELIINYFVHRHSSGFVEGLNNKLKVIKRCGYGFRNVNNFFRRIFLSLEGYRLYA